MEDEETKAAVKAAMEQHGKLVIGDEQHRQEKAMREIQVILNKYGVALVPRAMISPGGIEFMIETQAKPKEVMEKEAAEQAEKEAKRIEDATKVRPVSKKSKSQSGKKRKKG
ncbi:MAG: hypothetical protein ACW987_20245 [Candidatus Thorarchaeota archaeon]|jgi:hypothetical protein